MPPLKKAGAQVADRDLKREAGFAGVRCAMFVDQPDAALDFLRLLNHEFPDDPDVLYLTVHTYSDLSTRASAELAQIAPNSYQALELNAEALEVQGKWDEAAKAYQQILQQSPNLAGLHYRLGRILVSKPGFGPEAAEQAKQEFEKELRIDPSNAGAEYVLGELAKQKEQWDEAMLHFSRATKLDPGFGDAFVGLGGCLVSTKRFSEAIQPLENAVQLQPENPSAHYLLAIAYDRTGRKQDSAKEFSIQRRLTQKGAAGEDNPQSGAGPN
ncbi:MAG TPA: tetratricopeptide repeat protein [Terriglobales bacterium]|nr:tetratricopeptide repeat protein [Terriglobales bacterium]